MQLTVLFFMLSVPVMVNWCHTFAMKTNLALGMAFLGKIGSFYLKNKSGTAAKRIIVILMVIK